MHREKTDERVTGRAREGRNKNDGKKKPRDEALKFGERREICCVVNPDRQGPRGWVLSGEVKGNCNHVAGVGSGIPRNAEPLQLSRHSLMALWSGQV